MREARRNSTEQREVTATRGSSGSDSRGQRPAGVGGRCEGGRSTDWTAWRSTGGQRGQVDDWTARWAASSASGQVTARLRRSTGEQTEQAKRRLRGSEGDHEQANCVGRRAGAEASRQVVQTRHERRREPRSRAESRQVRGRAGKVVRRAEQSAESKVVRREVGGEARSRAEVDTSEARSLRRVQRHECSDPSKAEGDEGAALLPSTAARAAGPCRRYRRGSVFVSSPPLTTFSPIFLGHNFSAPFSG